MCSILIIVAMIVLGPHPMMFVNLYSFLVVFLVTPALVLFRFGKKAFFITQHEGVVRNQYIDIWIKIMMSNVWAVVIIGCIQMLANMKDPMSIGPALAIAMLSFLYAYLLRMFVFEPLRVIEIKAIQ